MRIPFENLDIHYGKAIVLEAEAIYKKVVDNRRGGFCYELNLLFHGLLQQLGFESSIIAARIFDSQGRVGPHFDHMCLLVKLKQVWLVDVGYGDLFVRPIALQKDTLQSDGRNYFKMEQMAGNEYLLLMSSDKATFHRKYTFRTNVQEVSDFASLCQHKQTSPESYFVQNRVCTKPTEEGRITLLNHKFICRQGQRKLEYFLEDEGAFLALLQKQFGVVLS